MTWNPWKRLAETQKKLADLEANPIVRLQPVADTQRIKALETLLAAKDRQIKDLLEELGQRPPRVGM
jgi:hypothetical protein